MSKSLPYSERNKHAGDPNQSELGGTYGKRGQWDESCKPKQPTDIAKREVTEQEESDRRRIESASTNQRQPERLRHEDTQVEMRRKRELLLKLHEEEICQRERELHAKEQAMKEHEQMMIQRQKAEELDNILMNRERLMEKRMRELQEREAELERREDALQYKTAHIDEGDRSRRAADGMGSQPNMYPKFSIFSGEEPKPKLEATFEEWLYEVNCTRQYNMYPEFVVSQALRKSLRGQAKRVLLPMGTAATVDEMIRKLDGVFGNVTAGESVLQEFYTTSQRQDESVATWGLRLEELLQTAVTKGHLMAESRNEMLRTKFWKGLKSEKLKMATRIHFETIESFEQLRREIRAEEHEMKISAGVQHRPMQTGEQAESQFEQMMKKIASLERQIQQLNSGKDRKTDQSRNDKAGKWKSGSGSKSHLN